MRRWYAVHTHPRKEDQASYHLRRQKFDVYLPRYLKRRRHARRVQWLPSPLFPRYLFVAIDVTVMRWRAIHSTFGVKHLVCNGEHPASVPTGVVEEFQAREDETGMVCLKDDYRKGEQVIVREGALMDQIGRFERMTDDQRVVVLLNLLGREVKVHLPFAAVSAHA